MISSHACLFIYEAVTVFTSTTAWQFCKLNKSVNTLYWCLLRFTRVIYSLNLSFTSTSIPTDPKRVWCKKKKRKNTIQRILMSRVCVLIPQPPSDCIVSLVALNAAEPEGEVGRLCFDTVEKQALFFLILFLRVPLCSLSPPCAQSCRHALRSGSFHVAESAHMHRPPISSEDL